ncbi:acyl-CoA synthetase family member 2, partial [Homo sapiens]
TVPPSSWPLPSSMARRHWRPSAERGVIAGSPAPPELIRAIINKINMKDLVKSQEEIAAWEDGQQSTDVLLERPGRLLMEPQRTVP